MARGRRIPVDLGIVRFESKTDAREFFQKMLNSYSIGEQVSASDSKVLSELLKRHPDAAIKIGAGVDHFEVGDGEFSSQCFYVHRVDGTYEEFSLHVCVNQ